MLTHSRGNEKGEIKTWDLTFPALFNLGNYKALWLLARIISSWPLSIAWSLIRSPHHELPNHLKWCEERNRLPVFFFSAFLHLNHYKALNCLPEITNSSWLLSPFWRLIRTQAASNQIISSWTIWHGQRSRLPMFPSPVPFHSGIHEVSWLFDKDDHLFLAFHLLFQTCQFLVCSTKWTLQPPHVSGIPSPQDSPDPCQLPLLKSHSCTTWPGDPEPVCK